MTINIADLKENRFDFVHDSQQIFHTLMMALAFPGSIQTLKPLDLALPQPDLHFILQPFLTLLDLETSFCVAGGNPEQRAEITRYIEINTHCPQVDCSRADYILCLESSLNGRFSELKRGGLSDPEKSATVFYLVDQISDTTLEGGSGLTLVGPGIRDQKEVQVTGLDTAEAAAWLASKNDYPLGIDIYLVSRTGTIIGIPRTARF